MLRVTPIYGSRRNNQGPASLGSCTLIEYAGVTVLVNVGGPIENYDWASLPKHDCLLITDSTMASMGSFPSYFSSPEAKNKEVYATFPTVKMGQMSLYDYHANLSLDGGKPPYSLDQMDDAFAAMHTIKYSQSIYLPKKEKPKLSITAHRAGHVIGGAFFVFQRLQDDTSVVVTSTYHVAKELHLDSSTLLKHGATPDVLVTRPGGPAMPLLSQLYRANKLKPPLASQSQRNIVEHILSVLRRDGNVLMPVDASGRVLELLLLLSQHWEKQRLQGAYNLVWMGPMVANTIEFCRSQLEWMAESLGNQFDNPGKGHPYALKSVHLCTSLADFESLVANGNPTCVLASGGSLDHGPARDLLLRWADNDNHAILFTDSACCYERPWRRRRRGQSNPSETSETIQGENPIVSNENQSASESNSLLTANVPVPTIPSNVEDHGEENQDTEEIGAAIQEEDSSEYTTSYQLLRHWCEAKMQDREMEDSVSIDVLVQRRAPLVGQELKVFMEREETARLAKRKLEEEQAMLREVELAKGRLRLGEDQQSQPHGGQRLDSSRRDDGGVDRLSRPKKKSRFDSSLFFKFSKPLHLTFEVRENAVGVGQNDSTAKFGIGEAVGNSDVLEDDYGIAVVPGMFVDIVTGVDPSKFAGGSGRIGDEVIRRGFGFGTVDSGGKKLAKDRNSMVGINEADETTDERRLESADLSEGNGIIRGRNGRPPSKVVTVPRKLQVLAEIDYIPLEGRVDSRAARQSVRALQPRQIVILGGRTHIDNETTNEGGIQTADEVTSLVENARTFLQPNSEILVPSDEETVRLEVGHAAFSVRLIANPFFPQKEASGQDAMKAVEIHETKLGVCSVSMLEHVATGQKVAVDGSIVLAPRPTGSSTPSLYISDGEVLLTDLRAEMIAQGMKAEYR
ncbi:unnamed protein product [Cylindrotheca closterium]|uniref:Cleavage and polyadenylation specificity factor subunit 2 n=1 Tax=Cylindrotheca closterium TaxID=2856 RepID=A0AAD2FFA5_9STRA|nr:unnamed protein product [Cylindrotheca closterium]